MPAKACPKCGAIVTELGETYCAEHRRDPNAHWSQNRNRGAQAKFRARLIREYGGQCGVVVDGVRCPVTLAQEPLQAHHTEPGNDAVGILTCRAHHKLLDPKAR